MNLIIVSGPEATCKSFIGRAIAGSLDYKYQSKDTIKEAMFDSDEHSTWDYRWYEAKAKQAFFREIEQFIKNETDAVIESNFIGEDKVKLEAFTHPGVKIWEVYCYAKGMTTLKRFVARNENGQRHKGHHDRRWYSKILLEDLLYYVGVNWPSKPSGITDKLIKVNTTDFSNIDTQRIIKSLNIT